jgi:hypothetical protein
LAEALIAPALKGGAIALKGGTIALKSGAMRRKLIPAGFSPIF